MVRTQVPPLIRIVVALGKAAILIRVVEFSVGPLEGIKTGGENSMTAIATKRANVDTAAVPAGGLMKGDEDAAMKKRSVVISGHRTSVSLENAFWFALKSIATETGKTVNNLVTEIDRKRTGNLSSAIRVFVLLTALRG